MKSNDIILKAIYLFVLFLFTGQPVHSQSNWNIQNSGTSMDLNGVFFVDQNTGWVCGSNGTILKTTNGGANWIRKTSGTQEKFRDIFFSNPDNGWVSGNSGIILHTVNGGDSWQTQEIDTDQHLYAIYFLNDSLGWTCDSDGSIFRTTDGGNTWRKSTINDNSGCWLLQSLGFRDKDIGWCIATHGIIKTTDGGVNWNYCDAPDDCGMTNHSGYFINDSIGWVTGSGGNYKTIDGGLSWIEMETYGGNDIYFFNEDDGWIAGTGVARTTDGGLHWEQQQISGISANSGFSALFFLDIDTGWIVGRSGTIIKTTTGSQTSVLDNDAIPVYFELHQNFPNPFNPSTTIRFTLQKSEHMTLKIFNLAGQEVARLVDDVLSAGEHQVHWHADGWPSGIYLYKLFIGGQEIQTKKMLFLK